MEPVLAVAVVQVAPLFVEYWTAYPVIALPPLEAGAVHVSDACPAPAVGVTPVGAPGVPCGVTVDEAAE